MIKLLDILKEIKVNDPNKDLENNKIIALNNKIEEEKQNILKKYPEIKEIAKIANAIYNSPTGWIGNTKELEFYKQMERILDKTKNGNI